MVMHLIVLVLAKLSRLCCSAHAANSGYLSVIACIIDDKDDVVVEHVSQMEHYAVEIWNSVVKKFAGGNLMALANAKCKLNELMNCCH